MPVQACEQLAHPMCLRATLLVVNGAVVALMLRALMLRRQGGDAPGGG